MFEQDRMLGRIQRRVSEDPDIFSCYLSGSYGRRANDAFADLDVTLVFGDEQKREREWRNRIQFAKSIMPYIALKSFDALHAQPYYHLVLFANGSKVDFRFENKDTMEPNPRDRQIRILKDSEGWAEKFQARCKQLPLPQPTITAQELSALDRRFWVMYWEVFRLLARGELQKALPIYLEVLYFTIPRLLEVLPPDVPERSALVDVRFTRDAALTANHLRDLLDAYSAARGVIIAKFHLPMDIDQSFEREIGRLIERLALRASAS